MRKPLTPWSEGWIEAIEREREQLEALSASALIAVYGERDAMLIDEVIADIAFEQHIGPWLDDEHESSDWEVRTTEIAALALWDIKRRVDRKTRRLIEDWLSDRAEKAVRKEAQVRAQEETDYRVFLHELMQAA
jgi:hypothetical protein